jgi:hypothetical protein
MNARIAAFLTAVALAAADVSGPAGAAGQTAAYLLNTRQFDPASAGEYDVRLRLQIAPDGIVSGTFMNTEGRITSVTGSLTGTQIRLDLDAASPDLRRYFTGTFVDGKLDTTARHGLSRWVLEGRPPGRRTPAV